MPNYRRVYIFTLVTFQRRRLLATAEQIALLREAFRRVQATRPFAIEAAVVLPEHLHCIWRLPPDDADYSGRWREIKKGFSGGAADALSLIRPTVHAMLVEATAASPRVTRMARPGPSDCAPTADKL